MTVKGLYTKTDLDRFEWLTEERDGLKPTRDEARFCLELSALAYDMKIQPWLKAGWQDAALQVDQRLITGLKDGNWKNDLMNDWMPRLAKAWTEAQNPVLQAKEWVSTRKLAQTGKAVTLVHALSPGHYLVAIGFMGTGKNPVDWLANLKLTHSGSFHDGFLEIARQYENNMENLNFPQTALELGIEKLSLADILEECKTEQSRFTILVSGHSQGAAVMQVWIYRQMLNGVKPEYLHGFGFASPSVAIGLSAEQLDCPIKHIINSDDAVGRVGLEQHLGRRYIYHAEDEFRELCYAPAFANPLFRKTIDRLNELKGTEEVLCWILTYINALTRLSPLEAAIAVKAWGKDLFPAVLIKNADIQIVKALKLLRRLLYRSFCDAMGQEPSERILEEWTLEHYHIMRAQGIAEYTNVLMQAANLPHALRGNNIANSDMVSYSYIVVRDFEKILNQSHEEGFIASNGC